MNSTEFDIKIIHLRWISRTDDPADLCVHGSVSVKICDRTIVDEKDGDGWTLSAAALNLMRTLGRDYKPGDFAGKLIPCCGFFLVPDDDGRHVQICGCESGFDWTILHEGNLVRHIAGSGEAAHIDMQDYRRMVLSFADKIQQFYNDSKPKIKPADDFGQKGYDAFWKEWKQLRNKHGKQGESY